MKLIDIPLKVKEDGFRWLFNLNFYQKLKGMI